MYRTNYSKNELTKNPDFHSSQRMRDKTADFTVRQNSRFWKRDKIADFDNETKPPILKWDKTADLL